MVHRILISAFVWLLSDCVLHAQSDSLTAAFRIAYERKNYAEFQSAKVLFTQHRDSMVTDSLKLEELVIIARFFRDIPFATSLLDLNNTHTHQAGESCTCGKHSHKHEN